MDPTAATYYRAFLFAHGQGTESLPPSLVRLHAWTMKKQAALGLTNVIRKETAIAVLLSWMAMTQEGRDYAATQPSLSDSLLPTAQPDATEAATVDWDDDDVVMDLIDQTVEVRFKNRWIPGTFLGHDLEKPGRFAVDTAGVRRSFARNSVRLYEPTMEAAGT